MTRLSLTVPHQGSHAGADALGWLLGEISGEDTAFSSSILSVRSQAVDAIELSAGGRHSRMVVSGAGVDRTEVSVAPGVDLVPPNDVTLKQFLQSHWRTLDHVGLNISEHDCDRERWDDLIAGVARSLPTYRLNVGSPNDIVMIVDDSGAPDAGVVELVHDCTAATSSFHICAQVDADCAELETAFPFPIGGYKPGDEPFFRSVALPNTLRIPAYLDLAFTDGSMMPWIDIVRAMGTRIC